MDPNKQRIAIAEACGAAWRPVEFCGETVVVLSRNTHADLGPNRWDLSDGRKLADDIPDYLSDLNAMHEAEKTLDINQQYAYGDSLAALVRRPENIAFGDDPENAFPFNGWGHFSVATLTAAQRAEAFLRTIGKWE